MMKKPYPCLLIEVDELPALLHIFFKVWFFLFSLLFFLFWGRGVMDQDKVVDNENQELFYVMKFNELALLYHILHNLRFFV